MSHLARLEDVLDRPIHTVAKYRVRNDSMHFPSRDCRLRFAFMCGNQMKVARVSSASQVQRVRTKKSQKTYKLRSDMISNNSVNHNSL